MSLSEFPGDWQRALVVVAHPDDMEYGGAAAVARWTAEGKHVAYLLATRGEAGIDGMDPAEATVVREGEQRESCRLVGVETLEWLDHPDGLVEYGLPLRRDIAGAIRRHRPELVVAVNHRETYGPGVLNMADHRVVGQATIDAVRDAANRWLFRDLVDEAWSGVRHVAVTGSPQPTHAVDVTDTFDKGVESLRAHSAYLAGLGDHPLADPEAFLRQIAEATGERAGVPMAVAFEVFDL
ncbi:MAG TPA: PIG-L deacetylase family protein [Jiangellales bacterium]|nr:PIG-L deacetylase family protein [Jiangellales bacterium]